MRNSEQASAADEMSDSIQDSMIASHNNFLMEVAADLWPPQCQAVALQQA